MNIKNLAITLGLGLLVFACVNRNENQKIIQAREIHISTMARYDSLYQALAKEEKKVIGLLENETDEQKIVVFKSISRSIDRSQQLLSTWEESVIGVPGLPEGSVTHHHDGDHNHSHDSGDEAALLKTLSDDEILQFQKAYSSRLDEMADEIRQLLTTMEMNQYYGK